ncbi:hypothetical protein HanRHA438_Chr09g0384091 [Helianthus annuus]|nr:hypothetical protein HanRHA438_Chr09g0384091 [Helianthus annuus]
MHHVVGGGRVLGKRGDRTYWDSVDSFYVLGHLGQCGLLLLVKILFFYLISLQVRMLACCRVVMFFFFFFFFLWRLCKW